MKINMILFLLFQNVNFNIAILNKKVLNVYCILKVYKSAKLES